MQNEVIIKSQHLMAFCHNSDLMHLVDAQVVLVEVNSLKLFLDLYRDFNKCCKVLKQSQARKSSTFWIVRNYHMEISYRK